MQLAIHAGSVPHLLLHVFCFRNSGSQISCLSAGFDASGSPNTSAVGPVQVFIDNAVVDMSGVQFEFRDDPVYTSVSPQNVIPA